MQLKGIVDYMLTLLKKTVKLLIHRNLHTLHPTYIISHAVCVICV